MKFEGLKLSVGDGGGQEIWAVEWDGGLVVGYGGVRYGDVVLVVGETWLSDGRVKLFCGLEMFNK